MKCVDGDHVWDPFELREKKKDKFNFVCSFILFKIFSFQFLSKVIKE